MYYLRRIWLVAMSFLGSMAALGLLLVNCFGWNLVSAQRVALEFPCVIDNTPLVILGVMGYEGAYVEGGDDEVVDVAAILILNRSDQMVRKAAVTLECTTGRFQFLLAYLPPGQSLMALDSNAQIWLPQQVYSCSGEYAYDTDYECPVRIGQTEDGILMVTNEGDHTLENIVIYHKNWSKEAGMYLGGIAYETIVDRLRPGQLVILRPNHFIPGISQIMAVSAQPNPHSVISLDHYETSPNVITLRRCKLVDSAFNVPPVRQSIF